jgi:hypothetical protein
VLVLREHGEAACNGPLLVGLAKGLVAVLVGYTLLAKFKLAELAEPLLVMQREGEGGRGEAARRHGGGGGGRMYVEGSTEVEN